MASQDVDNFRQRVNKLYVPTDDNMVVRMEHARLLIINDLAWATKVHSHLSDEENIRKELDFLNRWLGKEHT